MDRRVANLWLVGAGHMGQALLQGWSAAGIEFHDSLVVDPAPPILPEGLQGAETLPKSALPPRIVVVAVKPDVWGSIAKELALRLGPDTIVLSVMAGITTTTLKEELGVRSIARVMPNLPVAILKGAMAAYAQNADDGSRDVVNQLMGPLGLIEWLDREDLLDAATAIAGCGPAFVFRFIGALGDAAIALGLPEEQARRIAIAMTRGAIATAGESVSGLTEQADAVASRGGATRAGLEILDDGAALNNLIARSLEASRQRSRELSVNIAGKQN